MQFKQIALKLYSIGIRLDIRELFALPPIQQSAGTTLSVPTLPPQVIVTGDKEIDAVLWLREVIKTGQADLINKAMEAVKRIKTPLRELQVPTSSGYSPEAALAGLESADHDRSSS